MPGPMLKAEVKSIKNRAKSENNDKVCTEQEENKQQKPDAEKKNDK